MWVYEQSSGSFFSDGKLIGSGYSGTGEGKNNPKGQKLKAVGPIPCGYYTIGTPYDTKTHGPLVIPLLPDAANEMFGRSAFLIHGDSIKAPGTASHGYIIQGRKVRESVITSNDKRLKVVDFFPQAQS
mgnify:FL=1